MKIIDLLNKIANGEEIPKKIKVNEIIFEYQGDDYLYIAEDNTNNWLFSEPYSDKVEYLDSFLKTEVEIIEEEKKIPEKIDRTKCVDFADTLEKTLNTLDSLIDYLQSKGDK